MAPHIFRKYSGYNPNEIKCWSPSTVIDTSSFDVENIVFSRGSSKAGTAIPSPLARMELFDTAFHIVADDRNSLKGKTIYHQLISDCLDVMQLIFNTKNTEIGIGKKMWFREWKVRENIDKLKSKGESHPNNLLAKSFEQIFFDSINPRFTGTESIFLIFYENRLLGGTSPLTLFFTSPNWSRYISDGAIANVPKSADGDVFFDEEYKSLYERDKEFVSYIYKLLLQNKGAFNKSEGLRKYINKTADFIEELTPGWKIQFQSYQSNTNGTRDGENDIQTNILDTEYTKVLTNIDNKFLAINGINFYHQIEKNVTDNIRNVSDFVIRATVNRYSTETFNGITHQINPPLVLIDGMNIAGDYMERGSLWSSDTKLKRQYYWRVSSLIPLYERQLPQGNSLSSITYPFITTDDFLEDSLIEMPYKLNSTKFYTGFNGDFKYLLPIRKEYFNFFTLADLKRNLSITVNDGQIKVNLKVPIRNNKGTSEINFTRTYEKSTKHSIIENKVGLAIFPFYKITDNEPIVKALNEYTVLLAEKNNNIEIDSVDFYKYEDIINKHFVDSNFIKRSNKGITAGSSYYSVKDSFDLIEFGIKESEKYIKSLIIPEWPECKVIGTGKQFSFAIDFGTSNSHIAFTDSKDSKTPQAFEIKENDLQIILLNKPEANTNISEKYRSGYGTFADMDLIVNREFVPLIFGELENSHFSFPIRTATCEKSDFKSNPSHLFGNINIGFYIDHEQSKPNDINYTTNLKWLFETNTEDASNTKRIESFFTELLLLIRNKVILNNGEIKNTKICWMKPQSMGQAINDQLVDAWNLATRNVFKNIENVFEPIAISESLAPYYYFKFGPDGNFKNRAADSINIDIGGGTTDVIYLNKKANNYISTSFRFAANDIWGSGIVEGLKNNGFISNFLNFNDKNKRQRSDADSILDSFLNNSTYKSEDIISLLFKYDSNLKFTESIKRNNPELLFIFYLHYSAIIYHMVQLLESKEIEILPKYFTFTGKGSQYIKLMCGEDKLTEFTTLLLRSFTKMKIENGFKVILSDKPKETTANGGVLFLTSAEGDKIYLKDENEIIHFGASNKFNSLFRKGYTINEKAISNKDFNDSVLSNLQEFINKLLLVESENGIVEERLSIAKFFKSYNVKNLNDYYKELTNGNCLESGSMINDSYDSYVDKLSTLSSQEIRETFFFYGLKDTLYQLSKYITENK
jgi:hypothetical protein